MDPIGPFPLNGVAMPTWMLRYDKNGACTSPATRAALLDRLRAAPPSDVFVFAHGWNNDFDDAAAMYSELMGRFESLCNRFASPRPFQPLFVGITWPSIWLTPDDGPAIASTALAAKADAVLGGLAEQVAAHGGVQAVERVYALLALPGLDDAAAGELARLIAPAFGLARDEGAASGGRDTLAEDVLTMMRAMETARPGPAIGPYDDIDSYARPAGSGARQGQGTAQIAGAVSLLDPRWALRLFSLYQMKDRAGTVGYGGVAALLREMLAVPAKAESEPPRVHAIGHSFGCKLMLSALCAQTLPRPLASLLLLQPAVSHLCFAEHVPGSDLPGGYRAALSPQTVAAPIVSTYSGRDLPLHTIFHLALRRAADLGEAQIAGEGEEATSAGVPPSRYAALGGYGPRDAGQLLIDPLPGDGEAAPWRAPAAPIVAFDGSTGGISGHGDVTGSAIAGLLHRLVFRA